MLKCRRCKGAVNMFNCKRCKGKVDEDSPGWLLVSYIGVLCPSCFEDYRPVREKIDLLLLRFMAAGKESSVGLHHEEALITQRDAELAKLKAKGRAAEERTAREACEK